MGLPESPPVRICRVDRTPSSDEKSWEHAFRGSAAGGDLWNARPLSSDTGAPEPARHRQEVVGTILPILDAKYSHSGMFDSDQLTSS